MEIPLRMPQTRTRGHAGESHQDSSVSVKSLALRRGCLIPAATGGDDSQGVVRRGALQGKGLGEGAGQPGVAGLARQNGRVEYYQFAVENPAPAKAT